MTTRQLLIRWLIAWAVFSAIFWLGVLVGLNW